MDKALQTVIDFVEGRLAAKAFEQTLYADPALEQLLGDPATRWHDTYIRSDPYHYLIALDFDSPAGVVYGAWSLYPNPERRGSRGTFESPSRDRLSPN